MSVWPAMHPASSVVKEATSLGTSKDYAGADSSRDQARGGLRSDC